MKENTKEKRISAEISRLNSLFADMPEDAMKLCSGLIERAAFMRIELEDLEEFLKVNGWAEPFQQTDKVPPYDRARPQGQTYQTMNANYQKIIKQLNDMLPNHENKTDGFDSFTSERSEL